MLSNCRGERVQKGFIKSYLIYNKELMVVLVLAIFSAYYFILKGFPSDDYILYALGIQNILKYGISEIPKSFNGEMSFGYYLVIYVFMSLFKLNIELSKLMNWVGAVSSIILIYFVFKLFKDLFNNKTVSTYICLNVMLAPTIWLHSHFGHPILLALTFYMGSLFYFNKLAIIKFDYNKGKIYFLNFILFALLAAIFRIDIVLGFGGYLGIIYFSGLRLATIRNKLLLISGLFLLFLLILRYLYLGYIINPTGGRLAYHLVSRLDWRYIIKNILKNIMFWVVGVNIFIFFLSVFGAIRFGLKSKIGVMLLMWTSPFCIFLPFAGVEVSRLSGPTVPIIVAVAIYYLYNTFKKRPIIALSSALIVAQIIPIFLYYSIEKYYPLKVKIDDRYVAKVPIGFLFTDHYYRQKLILAKTEMAKKVSSESNRNVLIIDFTADGMYYMYYILQSRNIVSSNFTLENGTFESRHHNGLALGEFITNKNKFYLLSIDHNWQNEAPIRQAVGYIDTFRDKVHVGYFISEFKVNEGELFLRGDELVQLLESETKFMNTRKKLISK